VGRKHEGSTKLRKICCCGGAEGLKGGGGDAAAAVAHAVKGGNGKEEEDFDAAAVLPHVVEPVEAPTVYLCGGAEESKGGDGDAAATVARALKGGNGEEGGMPTRQLCCRTRWRPWER
jgi:hypothetical protein